MSNIHVGKRVFIGGRLYVVRVFDAITNAARVESVDGFLTDVDASTFDDETPSYRAGALPAVEVKYTTGASLADVRPLTCDIPIDVAECGTCGAPLPLFSSEAMAHERCNDCWEVERRLVGYLRRGGRHAEQTVRHALVEVCGAPRTPPRPINKKDIII